jgi:hypothetical protein
MAVWPPGTAPVEARGSGPLGVGAQGRSPFAARGRPVGAQGHSPLRVWL